MVSGDSLWLSTILLHQEIRWNYEIFCSDYYGFSCAIYLFKTNNENIRTISEICSRLIIKTTEQRRRLSSSIFIVNFEQISHIVLIFLLLLWISTGGWEHLKIEKMLSFRCKNVICSSCSLKTNYVKIAIKNLLLHWAISLQLLIICRIVASNRLPPYAFCKASNFHLEKLK